MANSNDNAIVRVERDGVEYFTVKATGDSAVSIRGLARMSGIPRNTVSRWFLDLSHEGVPKWLKPLQGMDLYLSHKVVKRGKAIKSIQAKAAAKFIGLVARNLKKDEALDTLDLIGEVGLTSYIQSQTGWLPEQYTAAPAAHKQLSRILDVPSPWVKLYDPDFCRQVYKWYGPQFYWIFCYCFLTPVERCKVDQLNPAIKGDRKHRIHQYLEEDTKQRLAPHVWQLIAIVNTAGEDKQLFLTGYQKHFGDGLQLQLKLNLM